MPGTEWGFFYIDITRGYIGYILGNCTVTPMLGYSLPMLPRPFSSPVRSHSREPTFRGHRRHSYMPIDRAELVEFRARQRTFANAYMRTSLSNLTNSVVIFKLFDRRFHRSEPRYFPITSYPEWELTGKCFRSWVALRRTGSYSGHYFLCTNVLLERGLCRSCCPSKRTTFDVWDL